MNTLKLLVLSTVLFIFGSTQAQVSVNVNVGSPPSWGPSGYSDVEYYYLPDIEAYYDVRASNFIYFGNNTWVRTRNLPSRYRNYDLYNGYKVVLTDYRGPRPYTYFKNHKAKYYKGYKGKPQKNIGVKKVYYKSNDNGHNDDHRGKKGGHGKGKDKD